jgi:hypothetical protein
MMNIFKENSQVEDDVMKISDLGGRMSEYDELKMDELTIIKMMKMIEKGRRFKISCGRIHAAEKCYKDQRLLIGPSVEVPH